MQANVQLVELDLSENAFGPIGAEGIEDFLSSPSAFSLQVLKLNNNGLGAGGKVIASALERCHERAELAGRKFQLRIFQCGRNRLEVPGAVALAKAFEKLGSLEEVEMFQDGITVKGIEALLRSFKKNPKLRVINLQDNTFTVRGAMAMAKILPSLPFLEVLNVADCLCRNSGILAIVNALHPARQMKLKTINFSGNEIDKTATLEAIDYLQSFNLATLIVGSNNYGSSFKAMKSAVAGKQFEIDLGNLSDDQGSLSDGDDNDEEGRELAVEASSDDGDESDDEASSVNEITAADSVIEASETGRRQIDNHHLFLAFCNNPTVDSFLDLGATPALLILSELEDEVNDRNPSAMVRVFMSLSFMITKGSTPATDSVHDLAISVCDFLLKQFETRKTRPLSMSQQIINGILAKIDALKRDDDGQTEISEYNLLNVVYLLEQMLAHGHFREELGTIQFFLKRLAKSRPEYAEHLYASKILRE